MSSTTSDSFINEREGLAVNSLVAGEDDMHPLSHQELDLHPNDDTYTSSRGMPMNERERDRSTETNATGNSSGNSRTTTLFARMPNIFRGPFSFILITLAIVWHCCKLMYTFLYNAFTFTIPTKQLYLISITLLCIQQIIQKIIEYLPRVWFMLFHLIGHENLPPKLQNLTLSSPQMKEIDILIEIMESLIDHSIENSKQYEYSGESSNNNSIGLTSDSSLLAQFKKPLLSIMIPTTILSIFIVITTTTFLILHMASQAVTYVSAYLSGESENGRVNNRSLSSSPIMLWGILSILILETIVPLICLCFGVYLSFSVGGLTWSFFVTSMFLISTTVLRYLRNRIYVGFQEGFVGYTATS